jgi:hypothetical protein
MLMDALHYWRICEELSVVQAALLIVGEDPSDYPEYFDRNDGTPKGYDATKTALIRAVEGGQLHAKIVTNFDSLVAHATNFNDSFASSITNNTVTNSFTNAGTFMTSFASGTTNTISVAFNDTWTVKVGTDNTSATQGTLDINGGGSSTGGTFTGTGTLQIGKGYTFDAATTISTASVNFSGGTTNLNGAYSAGTTTLSGGTLNTGSSPITLATNFTQSAGTLTGTGTVTVSGTASLVVPSGGLTQMYGPAVRRKRISSIRALRSCINVSGL